MRNIFSDSKHEKSISDKGYTVIRNFLPESKCVLLSEFFKQNDIVDSRAFSISNWNSNAAHRNLVYNTITETLLPHSEKWLDNFVPVLGVFTIKRSGSQSDMLLHQDWALVDETKFRSVSIWVALCDMDRHNGNLQVAEYSHLYAGFPRGMNTPVTFENMRSILHEKWLVDLPLKKGDAVVFDHRLIHASPENNSHQVRLAAVMALIPAEAELLHYYMHPGVDSELEILKMENDEFREVDFFDIPNKPKHKLTLRKIPAHFRQITIADITNVANEQTAQ